MSERTNAAWAARAAGGTGSDWRSQTGRGSGTSPSRPKAQTGKYFNEASSSPGSVDGSDTTWDGYKQVGSNIFRPEQGRYFTPVGVYTAVPESGPGIYFSSPRTVVLNKKDAIARWDAPIGSTQALPDWLKNEVRRSAYAYHGRQVPDSWVRGFWEKSVISAAEMGPGVTALGAIYEKVLSDDSAASGGGGRYYGGGGGYGGGSSTQQTIDLTSPQQARGLLMQTMQGVLGRNPSDREVDQFVKILNETQTANPQVVSAAGDTVTRTGGVDAGLVALDYAQSRDDYEDVQANQYYNMFLDVLAGG